MKNLSDLQMDMLQECFNMGVGKGADILNTMLKSHVKLNVLEIAVINGTEQGSDFFQQEHNALSAVQMKFVGTIDGFSQIAFPSDSAASLVSAFYGRKISPDMWGALCASALTEIGNVVLNGVMGHISNLIAMNLEYSVPELIEFSAGRWDNILEASNDDVIVLVKTCFEVEKLKVSGTFSIVFRTDSFSFLMDKLGQYFQPPTMKEQG